MIDNFEQIKSLLKFSNDDIYYHLQILRRGKDHPDLPAANRVIKSYFICKLESMDYIEEEVKKLCEFFGARAYINLAPKSIKKTTMLQLKYLTQRAYEGDFKKIWKAWNTCAGEIKGEESRWIIDIDEPLGESERDSIIDFIDTLEPRITVTNGAEVKDITSTKFVAEIPTKNGFHIITTPFNVLEFQKKYPNIDVHKNNPTILYVP